MCTKEALCLITHPLNHPCPLVCPISPGNECVSTHVAATCWDDGCLLKTLRGGSQERHSSCTARTKPCLNVEKAQSTLASLAQVPHFSFRFCAPFSSCSLDAAVFHPLLVLHKPRVSLVLHYLQSTSLHEIFRLGRTGCQQRLQRVWYSCSHGQSHTARKPKHGWVYFDWEIWRLLRRKINR